MANRYWVGGTSAWDATAGSKWSLTSGGTGGQAVPTATDDVFFDANSGVVTVTASASVCLSLTCTGFTGTLTGTVTVSGNTTLSSGAGTYTGLALTQNATGTITGNDRTIGSYTINGSAITATLGSALTVSNTNTTTLTLGSLSLNGYNLTTGAFSSTNANIRSISFGANNIVLNHATAGTTVLSMTNLTNFSLTYSTGGFVTDAAVTRTISYTSGSNAVTQAVNLSITSGSSTITFDNQCWFKNLNFTGSTCATRRTNVFNYVYVDTITLATGGNYTDFMCLLTRTQVWTPQFSKQLAGIGVYGAGVTLTLDNTQTFSDNGSSGSPLYIYGGGILTLASDLTFATLVVDGSFVTSINFGSYNINLSSATASQVVATCSTATNFSWTGTGQIIFDATGTGTKSISWGSGLGSGPQPSLYTAINISVINGAGNTLYIQDGSQLGNLDFTGSSCRVVEFSGSYTFGVFVDTLTLATGGDYTGFIPSFTTTQVWTPQFSKQLGGIGVGKAGVSLTIDDTQTYSATSKLSLYAGTIVLNGNVTFGSMVSNYVSGSTFVRSIRFGLFSITLSHTTAGTTVIDMPDATNFSWSGTGGFITDASITRTLTFGTTGGTAARAPNLTLTGSGTSVLTFTTGSWFNNLNFGTTAFTIATTTQNIAGNLTLSSSGTYSNMTVTYVGTGTLISNSKAVATLTINNGTVSGTLYLGDTFPTPGTLVTLTSGTLTLNGFNMNAGSFSSSNSNIRTINFGTNRIICVSTTLLSMATITNLTCTGTGGFQLSPSTSSNTVTCGSTAGSAANAPNVFFTTGQQYTIPDGCWFKTFDISAVSGVNFFANATVVQGCMMDTFVPNATPQNLTGLTAVFTRSQTVTTATFNMSSTMRGIGVNGTGVTVKMGQSFFPLSPNGSYIVVVRGTLDLNGYELDAANFASSNSNVRSVAFTNGGTIFLQSSISTSQVLAATATNFTATGTGGFFIDVRGVNNSTFSFGATAGGATLGANAPNVTLFDSTYNSSFTLTVSGYWKNLTLGHPTFGPFQSFITCQGSPTVNGDLTLNGSVVGSSSAFYTLQPTITGNSTLNFNQKRTLNLTVNAPGCTVKLGSTWVTSGFGPTVTLTAGTFDLNGINFYCGVFNSSGSGVRSIAFGSNNINLSSAGTGTILNMATTTNLSFTGTGGFVSVNTSYDTTHTYSCGSSSGSDSTSSPNLTIQRFTSTQTITTGSTFKNLTISGTGSVALAATIVNMYGDLILDPNSGDLGDYTVMGVRYYGSGTLTTNGRTIRFLSMNNFDVTAKLNGALTCVEGISLQSGTFDANNFNVTSPNFNSNVGVTRKLIMGTGTWTLNGDINSGFGYNTWEILDNTGLTIVPNTATINITSASPVFYGAGFTYYKLVYNKTNGILVINGSPTFNSITNSTQPCTVKFAPGTTTTVNNFLLTGNAGNLVTIDSSSTGTHTLYRNGGVYGYPYLNYLAIANSAATGGPWYAGSNSVDNGNNSGWIFTNTTPPTLGPGIIIGPGISIGV
jgi:hypothetical protein